MKTDLLVVGKGPAGVSSALYAVRGGLNTAVIAKDGGALEKASGIDNYYGAAPGTTGPQLAAAGEEQLRTLSVPVLSEEVLDLSFESDHWQLTTERGVHEAKAVILATGVQRTAAPFPGTAEFEGRGVSYCAVCDGFFFRGKRVAVLGSGRYALHEADVLMNLTPHVTLLTNGEQPPRQLPEGLKAETRKISRAVGEQRLTAVKFEDGEQLETDGLFIALGTAGGAELARKAGVPIQNGRPVTDENGAAGLPGLFLAGDCRGGLLQVCRAVYEGALAGKQAIAFLKGQK